MPHDSIERPLRFHSALAAIAFLPLGDEVCIEVNVEVRDDHWLEVDRSAGVEGGVFF
jgi:hypothetical protein